MLRNSPLTPFSTIPTDNLDLTAFFIILSDITNYPFALYCFLPVVRSPSFYSFIILLGRWPIKIFVLHISHFVSVLIFCMYLIYFCLYSTTATWQFFWLNSAFMLLSTWYQMFCQRSIPFHLSNIFITCSRMTPLSMRNYMHLLWNFFSLSYFST